MKFCMPHWDALRKAIDDRGLTHLVAKDGATATANMAAELTGQKTAQHYDPLMDAHWMITGNALKMGGLYLMTADPDGNEYCPLCEVRKHGGDPQEWIDGCTDSILASCQERGLTAPKQ
jgi:hypothetical protein